jgi:hypothetical protein
MKLKGLSDFQNDQYNEITGVHVSDDSLGLLGAKKSATNQRWLAHVLHTSAWLHIKSG